MVLLVLLGCEPKDRILEVDRDLSTIRLDTLRVAIARGPMGMKAKKHSTSGLEYTLLSGFAEANGLAVEFRPLMGINEAVSALRTGSIDAISGAFTKEGVNALKVGSSCAYNNGKLMLVARRPDPWYGRYWGHRGFPARIGMDLSIVDTAFATPAQMVPSGSDSLTHVLLDRERNPAELLEAIALGHTEAGVFPATFAKGHSLQFPHLSFEHELPGDAELVFALRSNASELKASLDAFICDPTNWSKHDAVVSAYAEPSLLRVTGAFSHPHHQGAERICSFDEAFKAAGDENGFDWKFLAALAFKESRFDTAAASYKGALGIMQLVPSTAEAMGMDTMTGPEGEIRAAARYLKRLNNMFLRTVPDQKERLGFILASYNAGPAHVIDAQNLARQKGLDDSKWRGHVERALLLLSDPHYYLNDPVKSGYCKGHSVFLFVREVLHYHGHYRSVGFK